MKPYLISFLPLLIISCSEHKPLFEKTDSTTTGVTFVNQLRETEEENVLTFEYFYNGGGVAAGDLNNDGLSDLFFTGNQVDNKLYLNKGNLAFDDISLKAGIGGRKGGWKTGVTLADVNADGWLDIYVCYSGLRPDSLRRNQLFINNHDLTFTDQATAYGLADSGYSVQANFFDYDLDGDLDCFLINHNLKNYQRKEAAVMRAERDYNAGDKLFRNMTKERSGGQQKLSDGKKSKKDNSSPLIPPYSSLFVDVSEQAGIKGNPLGFGLGVSVSDMNGDGYPDVYVANDFVEDDYLYINQRDGTFRDELRDRIEHTSYSAMGVDVADLNNDHRPDIMTLDMLPETNARQKTLPWPDNWTVYQAQLRNGFWHQNMRNMLQIQQANGQYAEIGQLAGVAGTDWSWGVLLADFDMDGFKDIFVSNGILRDFTNADFIKFSDDATGTPILDQIRQMPSTRTKNYIFRNNRDLTFTNEQRAWGFEDPAVSNGCAYADLDNDGDLDIITNNLNEPARIYRSAAREKNDAAYLRVQLKGGPGNLFGIGAAVTVTVTGQTQVQENYPTRGFESCSHGDLLFGLGVVAKPCQVSVRWPDGRVQTLASVALNQTLILDYQQSIEPAGQRPIENLHWFSPVDGLDFIHKTDSINNFDQQILLPTQYSTTGPRMAVGGAGDHSDVFLCGSASQPGQLFRQTGRETFVLESLPGIGRTTNNDAVFADLNGDTRPDLYVANGGYSTREPDKRQDQLWLATADGFTQQAVPVETENGNFVKSLDVDRDGDLDLLVGGGVKPFRFPAADDSFLLINDGKAHFTKRSLGRLGMLTDAAVLDVDRDGWPDVVLVGEWMPVTILLNQHGQLSAAHQKVHENLAGWWNRIEKADLDSDGDEDLILGNLGLNTQVKATEEQPATLTYDDFDQNGTLDFFMSYQIGDRVYPAYSRDEICEQVSSLRKRFTSYQAYANATLENCFDEQQIRQAQKKQIDELRTLVLENQEGEFIIHALPLAAQYAPIHAILAQDLDQDGKTDLLLMGNNSQMRLRIGKVDANHGLVLRNQGEWQFAVVPADKTGLYVRGDVRDVKQLGSRVVVGICNNRLQSFIGKAK